MFSSSDSSSEDEHPGFLRNPDGSLPKITNGPNFDKAITRQDKLSKLANETNHYLRKYGGPWSRENYNAKRRKILTERAELKKALDELDPLEDFGEHGGIEARIEYLEKTLSQLNVKKKQTTLLKDGSIDTNSVPKPEDPKVTNSRKRRVVRQGPMDSYFQNNVYTPPPIKKVYKNVQTSPFPSRQASRQISRQNSFNNLNDEQPGQQSFDIFQEIITSYSESNPSKQPEVISEVPRQNFSKDSKDDNEFPDFNFLQDSFMQELDFQMHGDIFDGERVPEKNWALMDGHLYDLKDFADIQAFEQDKEELTVHGQYYPDIEYLDDEEADWYRKNHWNGKNH